MLLLTVLCQSGLIYKTVEKSSGLIYYYQKLIHTKYYNAIKFRSQWHNNNRYNRTIFKFTTHLSETFKKYLVSIYHSINWHSLI